MSKQVKRKRDALKPGLKDAGALKLNDACRYLGGIAKITLRRQIEKGRIKPCRTLRHLLIPVGELDRWLTEGQDK
jgi:excisionase family DNA binding protein